MSYQIQIRRDTAANWAANNPVLAEGEAALVTDTTPIRMKIGDGVNAFSLLPFFTIPDATAAESGAMSAADFIKLRDYPAYADLSAVVMSIAGASVGEAVTLKFSEPSIITKYVCNTAASPRPTMMTYRGLGYAATDKVRLSAGVSDVKAVFADPTTIPAKAFHGVEHLTEVRIPSFVHFIRASAFAGTTISKVVCEGVTPPDVDGTAFDDFSTLTVYVPSVVKNDYMSSPYWGQATIDTIDNL